VPQAKVTVTKYADGFEETVAELTTNDSGNFGPIKLAEDTDYTLLVNKTEYLSKREIFTMFGRTIPPILLVKPVTDTTFYTDITLEKVFIGKAFRLENIYYDLNKYDIRPDAATELNKLVQILNDNPNIKIELGSHTDARSTDMYNLRLSQQRADAAINYIVSRGIIRERLTAKGHGESELIIERARSEEEHQVNRRTEFKVLEIGA
jgi:outer membrane protein OmpA-like peptidoglycan-associated protein